MGHNRLKSILADERFSDRFLRSGDPELYKIWRIPKFLHKKIVGYRTIEEPIEELKLRQKDIVKTLEQVVSFPDNIFGVKGTSALDNARYHQDSRVIISIDIKSFFPNTTRRHIATGLAYNSWNLLDGKEFDGLDYTLLQGRLPTGAPSSPILANIAMAPIDDTIQGLAISHSLKYSRYMDDLTFSGSYRPTGFVREIREILRARGYSANWDKLNSKHRGYQKQQVTGIVINHADYLSTPRSKRKQLRARLDQVARQGGSIDTSLQGELAYIKSVNEDQYNTLMSQYERRVEFYRHRS